MYMYMHSSTDQSLKHLLTQTKADPIILCACVHVCMCYHYISENTIFHYLDNPSMDEMGCERQEVQKF